VLQEAGLQVMCLDASQAMVDLATERGLNAVLGDLLQLPFKNESFDSVWAYTSLLHVSKMEIGQALNEIHRVLKPGGIFGLGLIEGEGESYRESTKVTAPRLFSYYQKEEVERLLIEHGFEIRYFETFKPRSKNYLNFISQKE
jgi:ubiquinone/menaquinone biosynthesis C-methylase UbiE